MDQDEGEHARFTLKGEMTVRLPSGASADLTRVEAKFAGDLGDVRAPFTLAVEGKMGELRKLAETNEAIARILQHVAGEAAEADGVLNLRAEGDKLATLRAAAEGTGPMDAQALLENVAWMSALFTFAGYHVESVGTVQRWTERL